jgi:hypothetical protein
MAAEMRNGPPGLLVFRYVQWIDQLVGGRADREAMHLDALLFNLEELAPNEGMADLGVLIR